ncbi:uncharacterized protein [Musca autumnalis]|uniref:uncharacterized protein n=1 Tax=Musca autumnalis TaxID=221902 RepID=UPI003CF79EFA
MVFVLLYWLCHCSLVGFIDVLLLKPITPKKNPTNDSSSTSHIVKHNNRKNFTTIPRAIGGAADST